MMNYFCVSGHVGNDPTFKTVGQDNTALLTWSFAFTTKTKSKESTTWMQCALWGSRADALKPYITKGSLLTLGGDIQLRKYQTQDGKDGFSLDMNVSQITLPPKPKSEPLPADQYPDAF